MSLAALLCTAGCGTAAGYYVAGDVPAMEESRTRLYVSGRIVESCWQGEKPRAGVACKVVRLRNAEVAAEGVTEPDGRFGLWVAPREERYMLMVEESRVLLPEE